MNKLGTFSWFGYVLPFDIRLDMVKDAGFSSTSIMYDKTAEFFVEGKEDLIPEMIRSRGLHFDNVHVPFVRYTNIWSSKKRERDEIKEVFCECVDYCSRHKIETLVIHISGHYSPPQPNRHGLGMIKDVVKYAEDRGVLLAVENVQHFHYVDYVFSGITSPNLGFCYDSGHDFLYSPEPGLILKKFGSLLLTTHFSDNDGVDDRHWIPEDGTIDWDIVKENFPKDYKGMIGLEVFPKDPEKADGKDFLEKAFERVKNLREKLFKGEE